MTPHIIPKPIRVDSACELSIVHGRSHPLRTSAAVVFHANGTARGEFPAVCRGDYPTLQGSLLWGIEDHDGHGCHYYQGLISRPARSNHLRPAPMSRAHAGAGLVDGRVAHVLDDPLAIRN